MHKLMEFICDEMDELENKITKDGKLSMAEIQYLDTLAHTKKNLLKANEMLEEDEYSGKYDNHIYSKSRIGDGYDYARRHARRDSMGRYSSDNDMLIHELRNLMEDAPDEHTKAEFKKFIQKIEEA